MNVRHYILATTYTFFSTMLFISVQFADAKTRTVSSQVCHYFYDNASENFACSPYCPDSIGDWLIYGERIELDTGSAKHIYCPVASDSYFPHANVDGLWFLADSNNNDASYSRACVKDYNSAGLSCGVATYWSDSTSVLRILDASQWNAYPASFPYILNRMEEGDVLSGFYMSD